MNNLAKESGNVFFYEQGGIYMVCRESVASDVGKTDWGTAGFTLWISCHNNLIHLSPVSFDHFECCYYLSVDVWLSGLLCAVSTSVWLCSSDYMECWLYSFGVWVLGLQDMAISQVTGSKAPIEPLLYLPLSELWFARINHTWWYLGKSYRYSKSSPNFSFSSQMIFVSNTLRTWSQHKSDGCYYYSVYLPFFLDKLGKTQFEGLQSKLNALVLFKELLKSFLQRMFRNDWSLDKLKMSPATVTRGKAEGSAWIIYSQQTFVLLKKIGCFLFLIRNDPSPKFMAAETEGPDKLILSGQCPPLQQSLECHSWASF